MMPEDATREGPAFETSLDELERVVKELERGDLSLEKSLELFERGMTLSADCKKQLEEAETKVELLLKKGTKTIPVPFDPSQENAAK
jgi:exodeoxyribonuclease VII small subunit